jgi:hypothetical protein
MLAQMYRTDDVEHMGIFTFVRVRLRLMHIDLVQPSIINHHAGVMSASQSAHLELHVDGVSFIPFHLRPNTVLRA